MESLIPNYGMLIALINNILQNSRYYICQRNHICILHFERYDYDGTYREMKVQFI